MGKASEHSYSPPFAALDMPLLWVFNQSFSLSEPVLPLEQNSKATMMSQIPWCQERLTRILTYRGLYLVATNTTSDHGLPEFLRVSHLPFSPSQAITSFLRKLRDASRVLSRFLWFYIHSFSPVPLGKPALCLMIRFDGPFPYGHSTHYIICSGPLEQGALVD